MQRTTDEYCCGWTHGATGRGDCDEYGDPGAEGRGRRRRRRGRGRDGPVCRGAVPAGGPGPAGAGSPGPDGGEAVRVECVLKLRTPLINTIEANIFHVRTRVGTFKGSQAVSGLGPPRAFSHGHRQAGILGPSHFTEPNAIFLIFASCWVFNFELFDLIRLDS